MFEMTIGKAILSIWIVILLIAGANQHGKPEEGDELR